MGIIGEKKLIVLRVQPWLIVARCAVACEWSRSTQHLRCAPRERVHVVHAQTTSRLLVDILLMTSLDQFSVREC